VLDRELWSVLANSIVQPVLLVFILTDVLPRIGQAVGGSGSGGKFSELLLGGLVAQAVFFRGLFRVALPLARQFDMTGELEDQLLAPVVLTMVAIEKIVSGALQSFFAALVVFPVAAFLPWTPIYLQAHWPILVTVTPLACYTSAALGLTVGTYLEPRRIALAINFVVTPLAFFGAVFYTWDSLTPVTWLKYASLADPLVYMSEGFRAALSVGVVHMPLPAIYTALVGLALVLTGLGVMGFKRRVLS
jgi:ABC-2 type transport system permease protein